MKNFFLKLTFVASFMAMIVATGCEQLGLNGGGFSVSVKEVGPEYVELNIKGDDVIEMAYIMTKVEYTADEVQPKDVFKKGTEVTHRPACTYSQANASS